MDDRDPRDQARDYLRLLTADAPDAASAHADDILLYLYRIRDTGASIAGLDQILHDLEADPDRVFHSEDRCRALADLLQRIAAGPSRPR